MRLIEVNLIQITESLLNHIKLKFLRSDNKLFIKIALLLLILLKEIYQKGKSDGLDTY